MKDLENINIHKSKEKKISHERDKIKKWSSKNREANVVGNVPGGSRGNPRSYVTLKVTPWMSWTNRGQAGCYVTHGPWLPGREGGHT